MTFFFRVLHSEEKGTLLQELVQEQKSGYRFKVNPTTFKQVPGSPFAYWVTDKVRNLFSTLPTLEKGDRTAKQGLVTADDFRFVRTWWEVSEEHLSIRWFPFAKGGAFSPFYFDIHLVVNWAHAGAEICNFVNTETGKNLSRPQNIEYFFRPGLTWPLRTTSGLGIRVIPQNCIFGHKGPAAFVEGDDSCTLLCLLAITTSAPFRYLVDLQIAAADAAARSYEVGVIQRIPVPNFNVTVTKRLALLAQRAWLLKHTLDTVEENSHAFVLPAVLRGRVGNFEPVAIEQNLAAIQYEIDDIAFFIYGLNSEDRTTIEQWGNKEEEGVTDQSESAYNDPGDEVASVEGYEELLSWCVGVSFGRFDYRLATGERTAPSEPDPFDPLPVKSPGMVPDDDNPLRYVSSILVDDLGHVDDLCAVVQSVLDLVNVSDALALTTEACRRWFATDFFPLHIKMYSMSRRKAPIYWQLATPSAKYSVWLYIHAFTKDTIYNVQNDYVAPKLAHEERKLESMRGELGPIPKASELNQLALQESFVEELRALLDEVKRIAPLWNPNLDDGVVINFAPLWRLVPQHKPWQKELKTAWEALCNGEYDWAHLAMHLWPERVIPKCATDRSLAIAHGLEDVFWVEGIDGKWKSRSKPKCPINELVYERTSPAVKSALKSLLNAPIVPNGRSRHIFGKGGNR